MIMSDQKNIMKRPRTLTRIAAVQAIFQWEQGIEKAANLLIEQFLIHRISPDFHDETYIDGKTHIPNIPLFTSVVQGFVHRSPEIDTIIKSSLPNEWPFQRLDPIIRAILRAAVTELLLNNIEPPKKVIINEYIDVSHAFSNGDESVLINGILNNLANRLRKEMENKA